MSLFLNCASSVINITAKVAYWLFTVLGTVNHGPPHDFWRQHRKQRGLPIATGPQIQIRPSDTARIIDISMASGHSIDHRPGYSKTTDSDMASEINSYTLSFLQFRKMLAVRIQMKQQSS